MDKPVDKEGDPSNYRLVDAADGAVESGEITVGNEADANSHLEILTQRPMTPTFSFEESPEQAPAVGDSNQTAERGYVLAPTTYSEALQKTDGQPSAATTHSTQLKSNSVLLATSHSMIPKKQDDQSSVPVQSTESDNVWTSISYAAARNQGGQPSAGSSKESDYVLPASKRQGDQPSAADLAKGAEPDYSLPGTRRVPVLKKVSAPGCPPKFEPFDYILQPNTNVPPKKQDSQRANILAQAKAMEPGAMVPASEQRAMTAANSAAVSAEGTCEQLRSSTYLPHQQQQVPIAPASAQASQAHASGLGFMAPTAECHPVSKQQVLQPAPKNTSSTLEPGYDIEISSFPFISQEEGAKILANPYTARALPPEFMLPQVKYDLASEQKQTQAQAAVHAHPYSNQSQAPVAVQPQPAQEQQTEQAAADDGGSSALTGIQGLEQAYDEYYPHPDNAQVSPPPKQRHRQGRGTAGPTRGQHPGQQGHVAKYSPSGPKHQSSHNPVAMGPLPVQQHGVQAAIDPAPVQQHGFQPTTGPNQGGSYNRGAMNLVGPQQHVAQQPPGLQHGGSHIQGAMGTSSHQQYGFRQPNVPSHDGSRAHASMGHPSVQQYVRQSQPGPISQVPGMQGATSQPSAQQHSNQHHIASYAAALQSGLNYPSNANPHATQMTQQDQMQTMAAPPAGQVPRQQGPVANYVRSGSTHQMSQRLVTTGTFAAQIAAQQQQMIPLPHMPTHMQHALGFQFPNSGYSAPAMMQQGLQQGYQRGLEQGIQKGIQQGIQQGLRQGYQHNAMAPPLSASGQQVHATPYSANASKPQCNQFSLNAAPFAPNQYMQQLSNVMQTPYIPDNSGMTVPSTLQYDGTNQPGGINQPGINQPGGINQAGGVQVPQSENSAAGFKFSPTAPPFCTKKNPSYTLPGGQQEPSSHISKSPPLPFTSNVLDIPERPKAPRPMLPDGPTNRPGAQTQGGRSSATASQQSGAQLPAGGYNPGSAAQRQITATPSNRANFAASAYDKVRSIWHK